MLVSAIARIEVAGPDGRARQLFFDDGSEPRLTSAAVLKALALEAETVIDAQTFLTVLEEQERSSARNRALQYLGYRERSRAELAGRLLDDGYPATLVSELVGRFVELQLVDDERFAASWTRTRLTAGFGPERVKRELRLKGIAKEVVERVLADVADASATLERARQLIRRMPQATAKERASCTRRLIAKGYDIRTALEALDEHPDECEAPDEPGQM